MNIAVILVFWVVFDYLIFIDSKCQESFECGNLGSLEFPLTQVKDPTCGVFMVDDCDMDRPRIQFEAGGRWYDILRKELQHNRLFIRDPELQSRFNDKDCNAFAIDDAFLPKSPHSSLIVSPNLTLLTCSDQSSSQVLQNHYPKYTKFDCSLPYSTQLYYPNKITGVPDVSPLDLPSGCSLSYLPSRFVGDPDPDSSDLFELLSGEFNVEWHVSKACSNCHTRGGHCLTNTWGHFVCSKGTNGKLKRNIVFIGCMVAAIASTVIILILCIWKKHKILSVFGYQKAKSANENDIELYLKNNGYLAPMRYTYSDIKKITKYFSQKLGQGGYGSVYKGKLLDNRLVAVKFLNESKGNGEEFMNEVASISRTSHINIVTLLGFCFEGTKRALIYEFMPNGSLEKYVQKNDSSFEVGGLGCQKLFEISLGIARGLEYLHQGCIMRILHFDIKPHNILLDKDFNPRISDFGLAKLCPNRSSIVSMLGARGTIGYIAPEVFSRNFGEVSHKSDVYSYGMMILEIAGGRKSIDRADVDRTSEIYFPEYLYKQLVMEGESDHDHSVSEIMQGNEIQLLKRKLIIVGLWCIQTNPRDRPSMTKVVAMLEGEVELLDVPPKPYLHSTPS